MIKNIVYHRSSLHLDVILKNLTSSKIPARAGEFPGGIHHERCQGCRWSCLGDHFDILATAKSDRYIVKIKETLLISELKPSRDENVGSEKLFLY